MKYRHFPAAVLAAGLLFCTLFSGFDAYADDKKGELTQNQAEARQEYEAEQAALNELKSAQAQTENEVAALTGQAAELAGQITDVTAAVQAAQTERLDHQPAIVRFPHKAQHVRRGAGHELEQKYALVHAVQQAVRAAARLRRDPVQPIGIENAG